MCGCIIYSGLVTPNDIHNLEAEVLKMQSFKHPNVMCLIGVCKNLSGGPAVVMPFMANGSVLHYLKKNRNNLVLDAKAEETMVCTLHAVKCNGVESASLPNVTTFMCYYSKLDEICCKVHWQQIFSI